MLAEAMIVAPTRVPGSNDDAVLIELPYDLLEQRAASSSSFDELHLLSRTPGEQRSYHVPSGACLLASRTVAYRMTGRQANDKV